MPIYEYECEAGHRFERYGALGGEQSPTCPHCGRIIYWGDHEDFSAI